MMDSTSLKLLLITFLGGIFANISKGDLALIFTGLAATSTVIYNVIKIYKEFKNKN